MDANGTNPIDRFLGQLEAYVKRQDRGALADLRRGFSETTEHRAWPYISPWCDLNNPRERAIWLTIAAGFATLEKTTNSGNMGTTLRALALGDGRRKAEEAVKTFDGRFRRLLTCHTAEELCAHLPGIIRAAKQKRVDINFRHLHQDLRYWGEKVKIRWAANYWGVPHEKGGEGA